MQDKLVALVTGANKRIGRQIAKDFAAPRFHHAHRVAQSRGWETAAKRAGADARALQLDATNQGSIAAAAEHVRNGLRCLDMLLNNAGVSHEGSRAVRLRRLYSRAAAWASRLSTWRWRPRPHYS
jgi:NAD(P)-dependent dehydrogenase (short-subunit alcohol dehydrogenase family)